MKDLKKIPLNFLLFMSLNVSIQTPNGTSNRKCSQLFFSNVRTLKIFIMKHFRHEKVMTIRTLTTMDQQYITVVRHIDITSVCLHRIVAADQEVV